MADSIEDRANQKGVAWSNLDQRMKDRLLSMFRASGGRVWLNEGFRTDAQQRALFLDRYRQGPGNGQVTWNGQLWHRVKGPPAAPPGSSMHEIGMAADLGGDLNWVQQHAAEFGLKTFAHVNGEPWHVQPSEFPNSRRQYEAAGGSAGASPPAAPASTPSSTPGPTPTPAPGPNADLIALLKALGVDYAGNAQPTPALMAFLNGIGLNIKSAGELRDRAFQRIGATATASMEDIDRNAGRAKENLTGSLASRGTLSSGEANTKYAQQAADVAADTRNVARTKAQGLEQTTDAYGQVVQSAKQSAIERVVTNETDQATARATQAAQEEAYRKEQEAADRAYADYRAAADAANRQLIDRYATEG